MWSSPTRARQKPPCSSTTVPAPEPRLTSTNCDGSSPYVTRSADTDHRVQLDGEAPRQRPHPDRRARVLARASPNTSASRSDAPSTTAGLVGEVARAGDEAAQLTGPGRRGRASPARRGPGRAGSARTPGPRRSPRSTPRSAPSRPTCPSAPWPDEVQQVARPASSRGSGPRAAAGAGSVEPAARPAALRGQVLTATEHRLPTRRLARRGRRPSARRRAPGHRARRVGHLEQLGGHPDRAGAVEVGGEVVDEQAAPRVLAERRRRRPERLGVGLEHAELGRLEHAVERGRPRGTAAASRRRTSAPCRW